MKNPPTLTFKYRPSQKVSPIEFNVSAMRAHLKSCLEAGSLTLFPKVPGKKGWTQRNVILLDIDTNGVTVLE